MDTLPEKHCWQKIIADMLIQANVNLPCNENKLLACLIKKIQKQPALETYSFHISELSEFMNIDNSHAFEEVDLLTQRLMTCTAGYANPDEETFHKWKLIDSMKYSSDILVVRPTSALRECISSIHPQPKLVH